MRVHLSQSCAHIFLFLLLLNFLYRKYVENKKDGDKSFSFRKCSDVKLYKESKVKFLMRCIKSALLLLLHFLNQQMKIVCG